MADERDQHEWNADGADLEVEAAVAQHVIPAADHSNQGLGEHRDRNGERNAEHGRQPKRVTGSMLGVLGSTCTMCERNSWCHCARQERHQRNDRQQDRRGDGQPGQLIGAEPTDDCRVDQHVHRLHRQRAKRRNRQSNDAPLEIILQHTHIACCHVRPVRLLSQPLSIIRSLSSVAGVDPIQVDQLNILASHGMIDQVPVEPVCREQQQSR